MIKQGIITAVAAALFATTPVLGQEANPDGVWQDRWGTTFTFELCGDGTRLCGVLNDIQGESRTEENLEYVNQQVVQAEMVAPNKWQGTILLDGRKAVATVEMTGPNELEITGCRGIFCSSIDYERVS